MINKYDGVHPLCKHRGIHPLDETEDTKAALQSTLTIPINDVEALDFDDEVELVRSLRGSAPVYPTSFPDTLAPRGDFALSRGSQTLPHDILEGLAQMDAAYGV